MSLKKILFGVAAALLVVIIVFVIAVALRSPDFRIERSLTMTASPAAVFAQVNDFHQWEAWSPWAKLDSKATNSFDGPPAGTGASFHWAGNDEVGEGGMTITESRPAEFIRIRLDFIKPMPGTSTADYTFTAKGDQTTMTWAMYGKNNFLCRAVCMFMDMDKMVGGQFEQGLAGIKAIVETPAK